MRSRDPKLIGFENDPEQSGRRQSTPKPRDPKLIGSLRPRGEGRWQSQARIPGSNRTVSKTWRAANLGEARKLHAQWIADVIGHRVGPAGPPLTEHLDQWVRHARLNPATELAYRDSIRRIERHTDLAGLRLRDLTPRRLAVALGVLADRYAPATVRTCRSVLTQALQLAVEWGELPRNPMTGVRVKTRRDLQRKTIAATTEQVQAMIRRETDPLWRMFWTMLAATGCRQGELCALRWSDVDLDGRQITISRTMTSNLQSERVVGATTKNGKVRVVPIQPSAVAALRAWRQHLAGLELSLAAADSLVFAGVKKNSVLHYWHKTLELAGIVDPITPHSIRHWYAVSLVRAGEVHAVVAEIMEIACP